MSDTTGRHLTESERLFIHITEELCELHWAEKSAMIAVAGEAAQRRVGPVHPDEWISDRKSFAEDVERLAEERQMPFATLRDSIVQRVEALLNEPPVWRAVVAVAERAVRNGNLRAGEIVDAIRLGWRETPAL